MPLIAADYDKIKQVGLNLLSNAVKFTRKRKKPRIEIGVREEEREFIFSIRDNGVGFDMQYAQKLFGVFQRLHGVTASEPPSFVGEDGYVELATVYYQTGIYEVSPVETATFEPAILYMMDKSENQLPVETCLAEGSEILLYDYWTRQVAYWDLSQGELTTQIPDRSSNNLDGIATGTTLIYGVEGYGRSFDGDNDYITVPDKPGLGIDDVVDEVISQHLQPGVTGIWQPTDRWDGEYSWDRTWS